MITFFALQPDNATRRRIVEWRERALPPLDRAVNAANLHITLVYLGETAPWQLDELLNSIDYGDLRPIDLVLDEMGYWPKPRVLWLGCSQVPERLSSLARSLNHVAGSLRLQRDRRRYRPHLTLARKLSAPPPAATEAPYFAMTCDEFVLMESVRSPHGVQYHVLETY